MNYSTSISPVSATPEQLAIEDVKRLVNIVMGLRNDVFVAGVDFGAIPGTGDKPTLLQPGMEKLLKALHLRAEYVERSKIEDFDKPLIYYRYECRLIDWQTGVCVGTAIGSANSHEKKWRWREQKRVCPVCGKPSIIKGNAEYGGGYVCWKKAEGCGAKFKDGDVSIEGQPVGQIENPDIMDQMNTIDKIAQKRALGSAIKTVANVSMLYTVDIEDFQPYDTSNVVEGTFTKVEREDPPPQPSRPVSVSGAGVPRFTNPTQPPEPPSPPLENLTPPVASTEPDPLDWTEEDPRLYHCDALVVNRTKTATQYILKVQRSATRIPLTPTAEQRIGDALVLELKPGEYPLIPTWSVYADTLPAGGWEITDIKTVMDEPEGVR